MIKKYLFYILLLLMSAILTSCGGGNSPSDGGNAPSYDADKGFLEKYKYTIKTEAQADEYAKDDSFLEINDKKVDFEFNLIDINDVVFEGSLSFKHENNNFITIEFKALLQEKIFELYYFVKKDKESYESTVTNYAETEKNIGTMTLDLKNQSFSFVIPKTELKKTKYGEKSVFIKFNLSEKATGRGSASITLKNDNEILITGGTLGKKSYLVLKKLLNDNPNVKTIVLGQVNGSVDDEINVETGRMIRAKGLNTKVLKDSNIASGGVDLFASGVERIYTKGAKIRVHSWSGNGKTGDQYPKNDKAHHSQLGYFTKMLPSTGYDFYFYTLSAAPYQEVYTMKESEIIKYKLATKVID